MDLTSPEFDDPIKCYAKNLRTVLESNTGLFSAAREAMPRSIHREIRLVPHALQNDLDSCKNPDGRYSGGSVPRVADIRPPVLESDVLHDWLTDASETPLLIIAPVGAGKSWLLESFAHQMVLNLLNEPGAAKVQRTPPVVPLLVPLSVVGGRPVRDFLYKKAEIHSTPRGAEPVLAASLLDRIILDKRLVLLVDGFDEIPPYRREQFASQINELRIRFALTSRPGYGAERFVHTNRRHTLQELADASAREYVQSYFTSIPCPGFSPGDATSLFAQSLSGPIAHLLTRPLHLKAWCDHVHHTPDHHPPRSLGELAKRLLASYAERRQLFQPLRVIDKHGTGDYQRAIIAFSRWLGTLGHYFATRDFSEQKFDLGSNDPNVRQLYADAHLMAGDRKYNLWEIAIDSGLLIKIGDEYYLSKVPLVEYCIGKYLADEANANAESPRLLIETFRRWIWRPKLHSILDYTFDALWNEDYKNARRWASDLLQWAVDVSRHDCTRPNPLEPLEENDLACPFALTTLRWHDINAEPSEQEFDQALEAVEQASNTLESLYDLGGDIVSLCDGPSMSAWLLMPFAIAIWQRHSQRSVATELVQSRWKMCVGTLLRRTRGHEASDILFDLFSQFRESEPNFDEEGAEFLGIIASQVGEDRAAAVIEELIEYCDSFPNQQMEYAWRYVIAQVAARVPSAGAPALVERWIAIHTKVSRNTFKRVTWRDVIEKGATQVSSQNAANVARDWIRQYSAASTTEARAIWWTAILGVVSVYLPQNAIPIMRELISIFHTCVDGDFHTSDVWESGEMAPGNAKRLWSVAIPFVALSLHEDDAAGIVREFLALSDAGHDDDAREMYLQVVDVAVGRLSPVDRPSVLKALIGRYENSGSDLKLAGHLLTSIVKVSSRMVHYAAFDAVKRLLAAFHSATYRSLHRADWMQAVMAAAACAETKHEVEQIVDLLVNEGAASVDDIETITPTWPDVVVKAPTRLRADEAADCVTRLVARARAEGLNSPRGLLYLSAIWPAAGSINEIAVPRILSDLIDLAAVVKSDKGKSDLEFAVQIAAEQAHEKDVETVFQQMIFAGMISATIGAAVTRQDVLIIGRSANATDSEPRTDFEAYRREAGAYDGTPIKFILDLNLVVAPATIRDALAVFPLTEGFSPNQQFELLLNSMAGIPFERRYDELADGHPRDNFRSRWCANVRKIGIRLNLLDESNDMRSINGFVWVRRARFDALLKDQRVADEISRRLLARPSKTKKKRKSS